LTDGLASLDVSLQACFAAPPRAGTPTGGLARHRNWPDGLWLLQLEDPGWLSRASVERLTLGCVGPSLAPGVCR